MNVRAVICDIYQTVLAVGPAPAQREELWRDRFTVQFGHAPSVSLAAFEILTRRIIAEHHARARSAGIDYPEVYWPDIVRTALPEAAPLSDAALSDFLVDHAALTHTVSLMPGAVRVLAEMNRRQLLLGIASNAQPYTLRELDRALAQSGTPALPFDPSLCFWSFAHGFSKPSPYVFRLLTSRLRLLGVRAHEILMIGDRLDNDIEPARAQGWLTWRLGNGNGHDSGSWAALAEVLGFSPNTLPPSA